MTQNKAASVLAIKGIPLFITGLVDPSVVPVNALAGTIYIKTTTPIGYFQKQDDGLTDDWLAGGSGGPGPAGTSIFTGAGAPGAGLGHPGDSYINTTNGDLYTKGMGGWGAPVSNLTGPPGTAGAPGTNGTDGTNGTNGTDGTDGVNGSTTYNGVGVPAGGLGVSGDYYFQTNGNVYQKTGMAWGAPIFNVTGPAGTAGTNGTNGTNGATWYNGAGAPSAGLGMNGDFYINNTNDDVYNKAAGAWGVITNIKGVPGTPGAPGTNGTDGTDGTNGTNGTNGSQWFEGAGAPSAGLGVNGDFYLNGTNGDVYTKAAGAWGAPIANIKGTPGANGVMIGFVGYLDATGGLPVGNSNVTGGTIPAHAIILNAWMDVQALFDSATHAATIKMSVEADQDLFGQVVVPDIAAGINNLIPDGSAGNAIKTTAVRNVVATIGVEALTSGKAKVFAQYVQSE